MFGNYTEWDGEVDYIYFQMYTKDMAVGEEFAISGFYDLGDDYTDAPSTSMVPSRQVLQVCFRSILAMSFVTPERFAR